MASFCLRSSGTILKFMKPSRFMALPSTSFMSNKIHMNNDTIDPADLKHLSKFAAEWWDPEGPLKPLHSYNVLRVPFIRDSLVTLTRDTPQSTCLRGKKILEVGCGAGILSERARKVRQDSSSLAREPASTRTQSNVVEYGSGFLVCKDEMETCDEQWADLAKLGADLTGIDPSKELVQAAIEHAALNSNLTNKPTYIYTTIEEHVKHHSNEYDALVASEVIEHINTAQREFFLESCVKALKPGGKIIITTPNRTRMSQLLGIFLVEGLKVVPRGSHQYRKFSTQEELKYWLELNDCYVDLVQGYVYYFWSHQWKWINWQGLMYAMRAVKVDKHV